MCAACVSRGAEANGELVCAECIGRLAAAHVLRRAVAWENPGPLSVVRAFFTTWRDVVLAPRAFFSGLAPEGGLWRPFLFAALCLALGFLGTLWGVSQAAGMLGGGAFGVGVVAVTIALAPATYLAAFAVTVLLLHLLARAFGGNGSLRATVRAVAYAQAAALAGLIPALGGVLELVLRLSLYGWGVPAIHGFSVRRALLFYVTLIALAGGVVYCAVTAMMPFAPLVRGS